MHFLAVTEDLNITWFMKLSKKNQGRTFRFLQNPLDYKEQKGKKKTNDIRLHLKAACLSEKCGLFFLIEFQQTVFNNL